MGKKIKIIVIIFALCALIVLIPIAFDIWYTTFDVSGLELYGNSEIEEIYTYNERIYFTTKDKKVYVAGEYAKTASRTFRNSEFTNHSKLKTPTPVLLFEGEIKEIIPYSSLGALIITRSNELYDAYDLGVSKIAESVIYAHRDTLNEKTYIINEAGNLLLAEDSSFIASEIKSALSYQNRLFVLYTNGTLCELKQDEQGKTYRSEAVFENVHSFEIIDTHIRHN